MKAKENPLNQSVTGNPYYDYLIHEVQVVCNCPTDKAMAIVSYVTVSYTHLTLPTKA